MKNLIRKMITTWVLTCLITALFVTVSEASVPFKGGGEAAIVAVQPGPDGVAMTAEATGHSTHLGKFIRVENILLAANGTFTGTVVFTAANGDQITGNIQGGFTSESTAAGTYTFTGGTGRFEGSTGTAEFSVEFIDPVHFNFSFSGSFDK